MGRSRTKETFQKVMRAATADSYKRYRTIRVFVHMYNFRVRNVLLNQLRTVYADAGAVVQP